MEKGIETKMDRSTTFNHLYPFKHGQSNRVLVNVHDTFSHRYVSRYGEYNEAEVDLFTALVRTGDHVLNVGANLGLHTVALADLVGPGGVVYAVEPQRIPFQTLCANIALNSYSNVYAMQAALGRSEGVIRVPVLDPLVEQNSGGVTLTEPWEHGDPVRIRMLDSLELPRLNFVLMDVEGMESQVLEGGLGTLSRLRPIIYAEFLWNQTPMLEVLSSLDYKLWTHNPVHGRKDNYLHAQVNPDDGNTACPMLLAVHPESSRQLTEEMIRELGLCVVVETRTELSAVALAKAEVAA
jgi:FkbM family methyltransferase